MSLEHIGTWEEKKVDEERKRYWTLLNSDFFLQGLNFMIFFTVHFRLCLHWVRPKGVTEETWMSQPQPNYLSCSHSFRRLTPKLKQNLSILLLVLLSDAYMVLALTVVFCLLKNFYFFTVVLLLINFLNQYQWQYEGEKK